jgi:hypothetical protein
MDQAVEEFYKIKMVRLKLSANARRLLAENIQVIALGDKKVPSIVIYDNGEGQHPDHFKTHSCHYTKAIKRIYIYKVSTIWVLLVQ